MDKFDKTVNIIVKNLVTEGYEIVFNPERIDFHGTLFHFKKGNKNVVISYDDKMGWSWDRDDPAYDNVDGRVLFIYAFFTNERQSRSRNGRVLAARLVFYNMVPYGGAWYTDDLDAALAARDKHFERYDSYDVNSIHKSFEVNATLLKVARSLKGFKNVKPDDLMVDRFINRCDGSKEYKFRKLSSNTRASVEFGWWTRPHVITSR